MIFIVVKFTAKPEYADRFLSEVRSFTEGTRSEPGNLWFDWSRSADNDHEFILVEAFADDAAGAAHVGTQHFKDAIAEIPKMLATTPDIINTTVPGTEWSKMGEMQVE